MIVVRDASGAQVDRTVTNAAGTYFSAVGAGTYTVEPQPVTGLMGTPPPQHVVVAAGERATADFDYDTGIRCTAVGAVPWRDAPVGRPRPARCDR